MFISALSQIVLYTYNLILNHFYLLWCCFLAGRGSGYLIKRIYASGINNYTPNTNNYVEEHFKNTWGWNLQNI